MSKLRNLIRDRPEVHDKGGLVHLAHLHDHHLGVVGVSQLEVIHRCLQYKYKMMLLFTP